MIKSSQAAVDLIVAEEVSSQAVYQARYQHPEWPGGASGVTIGIGYDCGYSTANTIQGDRGDKPPAPMVKCLQDVAGIHGSPASSYAQCPARCRDSAVGCGDGRVHRPGHLT
jgi:hypothetical protein